MSVLVKCLKRALRTITSDVGSDNSSKRDEWVQQQLREIPSGKRLLDAGAGECKYKSCCSHLDYVSQDFCQYSGTGDGKGLQTSKWYTSLIDIVSDITSIPAPDASFDAVLCTEVFEHIFNPADAVREFSRLLVKGGKLILTAPFCSLTHFAPYHFATGFNRYWYEQVLRDNNLMPLSITPNGNYFGYIAQELRRVDSIGARYSGRKLGLFGRIAEVIMLRRLSVMSNNDTSSSELLCFGYHVVAEKA